MPAITTKPKGKKQRHPPKRRPNAMAGELPAHYEAFAQSVAEGNTAADAYKATVASEWATHETAMAKGSALLARGEIRARVQALRLTFKQVLEDRLGYTKATHAKILVDQIRTPVAEVNEFSPLAHEVTYDADGSKKVKMANKLDAMKHLAEVAGYKEPEKIAVGFGTTDEVRAAVDKLFAKKE